MRRVRVHEAKTHFSKLLAAVEQGEQVIVSRGDVPVARIVPYAQGARPRKAGRLKGQIWMADDFDETPPGFEDYVG